uniref:Platelet-derived growth factor (PDGF) family profile domain-containing protein n=1 Tax=Bracon brevicornis TaxID=1563983 RepID=A0A6V7M8S7_9HYME
MISFPIFIILTICIAEVIPSHIRNSLNADSSHQSKRSTGRLQAVQKCIEFSCKKGPQKRTYHMMDLLHDQNLSPKTENLDIEPAYLVVQRCDGHAGCCHVHTQSCGPVAGAIKNETIVVSIMRVESMRPELRTYNVEQHTKCECQVANKTVRDDINRRLPGITCVDGC